MANLKTFESFVSEYYYPTAHKNPELEKSIDALDRKGYIKLAKQYNIDPVDANAMLDFIMQADKKTSDEIVKNIEKGKYGKLRESVSEARRSVVHRAAKKGSYPAVVVVIEKGKVVHQEPVALPEQAPAVFNTMQEKYPNATLHLEDATGKRLFTESLNEANIAMRPSVERLLKQKGYDPIFQTIDNSKRDFKRLGYTKGEIEETLFDMFGNTDPKIVKKIKESFEQNITEAEGDKKPAPKPAPEPQVDASEGTFKEIKIDAKKYNAVLSTFKAIAAKQAAMGQEVVGVLSLPGSTQVYEILERE